MRASVWVVCIDDAYRTMAVGNSGKTKRLLTSYVHHWPVEIYFLQAIIGKACTCIILQSSINERVYTNILIIHSVRDTKTREMYVAKNKIVTMTPVIRDHSIYVPSILRPHTSDWYCQYFVLVSILRASLALRPHFPAYWVEMQTVLHSSNIIDFAPSTVPKTFILTNLPLLIRT